MTIVQRQIIFDPVPHKYTDTLGNIYTSVTTLIDKYHEKFDIKGMARRCAQAGLRGNPKYAGKSAAQLEREWKKTTEEACEWGSEKHDYNDNSIKSSNGFFDFFKGINTDKHINTYSIYDISLNPAFGEVDLNKLTEAGFAISYPIIFNFLKVLVENGWRLYSEILTYNADSLVCGMIDLLAIKGKDFIIIDWKTNAADIMFESGYFIKNVFGERTSEFRHTNNKMTIPGFNIPDSVGHKYSLQLSLYAHLITLFGYNYLGGVIFHIRRELYNKNNIPTEYGYLKDILLDKPKTDIVETLDLREACIAMLNDHRSKLKVNTQLNLLAK